MKDVWKRKRNKRIAASANWPSSWRGSWYGDSSRGKRQQQKNPVADDVTINKWHDSGGTG